MILVGELNPYGANPKYALYPYPPNSAGARLRDILNVPLREYIKLPRFNLCVGRWRAADARVRALEILKLQRDEWIVLLGRKVAEAFKASMMPPFSADHERQLALLPHPSGRCLAWNEPGAAERARTLLASLP